MTEQFSQRPVEKSACDVSRSEQRFPRGAHDAVLPYEKLLETVPGLPAAVDDESNGTVNA